MISRDLSIALRHLDRSFRRVVGRGALEESDAIQGTGRFIAVGIASTLLYLILMPAFYAAGLGARWATAMALVACWGASYVMQSTMTFRADCSRHRFLLRFVVMSVIGLSIAEAMTILVYEKMGFPIWTAALAASIMIPLFNFIAMNFWVFRDQAPRRPPSHP